MRRFRPLSLSSCRTAISPATVSNWFCKGRKENLWQKKISWPNKVKLTWRISNRVLLKLNWHGNLIGTRRSKWSSWKKSCPKNEVCESMSKDIRRISKAGIPQPNTNSIHSSPVRLSIFVCIVLIERTARLAGMTTKKHQSEPVIHAKGRPNLDQLQVAAFAMVDAR
jgi:hypothetical protein